MVDANKPASSTPYTIDLDRRYELDHNDAYDKVKAKAVQTQYRMDAREIASPPVPACA